MSSLFISVSIYCEFFDSYTKITTCIRHSILKIRIMDPIMRIRKLALFLTFCWSPLILTSCATLSGCNSCASPYESTSPYTPRSFVLVEVDLHLVPNKCVVKETRESCDHLLVDLPPKTISTRGSGTIIKSVNDKTYILTADHVCNHPTQSFFEMPFRIPGVTMAPGTRLTAVVSVEQSIQIISADHQGLRHESKVHATDTLNDVCLLVTTGDWGSEIAVSIAESLPALGARVYSISAPFGMFEPGNPGVKLHFEGRYSGHDDRGNYFYTVPARPGSSGSAILNDDGEIVGVVHSAMTTFEHVALSSSLESIRALAATIPKEQIVVPEHREVMHYFIFGF